MSTCPTCHDPVIAAITPVRGTPVLVDAAPDVGGSIVFFGGVSGGGVPIALGGFDADHAPADMPRYRLHDCPDQTLLMQHCDYCIAAAVRTVMELGQAPPQQVRTAAADLLRSGDTPCLCGTDRAVGDLGHAICATAKQQRMSSDRGAHPALCSVVPAGPPPFPDDGTTWVCPHGVVHTASITAAG